MTLDHIAPVGVVTVFGGMQAVTRVQAVAVSDCQPGGSRVVTIKGAVRQLNLPTIGASLDFPAPPPVRRAGHDPLLPRLLDFAWVRLEPW